MTAAKNDPATQRYDPAVALDILTPHPDNPRAGDVGALLESIDENGFAGAILAQSSSNRIIAGEHRWRARQREGAETIPVIFLDVDDDRALRILLADNRANDLAGYHDDELDTLLRSISETDDGLLGTLWESVDEAVPASLDEVPVTDQVETRSFDQVHMLISFAPELLGDVQEVLEALPDSVTVRSSVN